MPLPLQGNQCTSASDYAPPERAYRDQRQAYRERITERPQSSASQTATDGDLNCLRSKLSLWVEHPEATTQKGLYVRMFF